MKYTLEIKTGPNDPWRIITRTTNSEYLLKLAHEQSGVDTEVRIMHGQNQIAYYFPPSHPASCDCPYCRTGGRAQ